MIKDTDALNGLMFIIPTLLGDPAAVLGAFYRLFSITPTLHRDATKVFKAFHCSSLIHQHHLEQC